MPDGTVGPRLSARMLLDGRRLHLSDGPIDLIIGAWGEPGEVARAHAAATACAAEVLDALCSELPALRAEQPGPQLYSPVAVRMQQAVAPHAATAFITPMAAVAGAVAEHVLAAMLQAAELTRAYVNNGGDIALHLAPGTIFTLGIAGRIEPAKLVGTATIKATDNIRGVATSGWPGRSHSLGIADAVTVLAATASEADAAATAIANAIDLPGHPGIRRVPARSLAPDSDLGDRMVTRGVQALSTDDIATALGAGFALASSLQSRGLIRAAFLHLQDHTQVVGPVPLLPA